MSALAEPEKWATCLTSYQRCCRDRGDEELGAAIYGIEDDLDAAHLRPSSIQQRAQSGVKASCFGLYTLVNHLHSRLGDTPSPNVTAAVSTSSTTDEKS